MLMLLNLRNYIFQITFILKLANRKIFFKEPDFFYLFSYFNNSRTISNVFKLLLSNFWAPIFVYYTLRLSLLMNLRCITLT